ncbi:MAG: glutaredoxin 3 [Paraglaciecola sp.]|uniref:glutaredoxin 3 n=2 Tax=Alteromonadaceae TaxID=72275 RepID=UPI0010603645|nr:glutaredoxin 3 [Paraglaciecola marina]
MSNVIIYTKGYCPYCHKAKALLTDKQVNFKEIDIEVQPELRGEMISLAEGRSTVPQIFINNKHVGGCDDLFALEAKNKLDSLLAN